ncbi:hypothetical protein M3Y98_00832700 [Aphelenchoides besseyi]|nr:hypothetical protein M3Y98_00832700 [Aphelenchoides besseyi]
MSHSKDQLLNRLFGTSGNTGLSRKRTMNDRRIATNDDEPVACRQQVVESSSEEEDNDQVSRESIVSARNQKYSIRWHNFEFGHWMESENIALLKAMKPHKSLFQIREFSAATQSDAARAVVKKLERNSTRNLSVSSIISRVRRLLKRARKFRLTPRELEAARYLEKYVDPVTNKLYALEKSKKAGRPTHDKTPPRPQSTSSSTSSFGVSTSIRSPINSPEYPRSLMNFEGEGTSQTTEIATPPTSNDKPSELVVQAGVAALVSAFLRTTGLAAERQLAILRQYVEVKLPVQQIELTNANMDLQVPNRLNVIQEDFDQTFGRDEAVVTAVAIRHDGTQLAAYGKRFDAQMTDFTTMNQWHTSAKERDDDDCLVSSIIFNGLRAIEPCTVIGKNEKYVLISCKSENGHVIVIVINSPSLSWTSTIKMVINCAKKHF